MSLLSTYNSIKSLLVNKLTNKGISDVSVNDGLTTLINKIDDIESGGDVTTTITGNTISGTYPPNTNIPISTTLKAVYENNDEISLDAPLNGADIVYDFIATNDNTHNYTQTIITNSNGVASFNFNTPNKDTYSILVSFLKSEPFNGVSNFLLGTITIFESIIKYFKNISFSHSEVGSSMNVSYTNNESVTMTVQSFEEDEITPSIGSQVDYLIGTILGEDDYEDITLEPNTEYDLNGYDFDIIQLNRDGDRGHDILYFGDYERAIYYDGNKYVLSGYYDQSCNEYYVRDGIIHACSNEVSVSDMIITTVVNNIVIRKYNNIEDDFVVVDTVLNDTQGLSSYEYEAQGIGEVYIKAQSHDDPTIQTESYLISDWIKKDFTGVGNWIAFTGRVNTFSSNTDTTFTQGNGSKGGVHSQNTIFHLPNDDYVISFKIANGTIGTGVRVGFHSASYDNHHEKAVIGIENDSSGGFKFDYSTSDVTTVTKVTTGVSKLNTDDLIEFEVIGDDVTFYINGTSYGSATLDWLHTPIWLYGQSWSTNNGNFSITDLRVKRIINE